MCTLILFKENSGAGNNELISCSIIISGLTENRLVFGQVGQHF